METNYNCFRAFSLLGDEIILPKCSLSQFKISIFVSDTMMYDRVEFSYQIWKCKAEGQFICACSVNFSLMRETAGSISWRTKRPKTVVNHDLINSLKVVVRATQS